MKIIYCSQFIQEIQKITAPITEKIRQTCSFLSKLFSVKNTDQTCKKNAAAPGREPFYQQRTPVNESRSMPVDIQFSPHLTGKMATADNHSTQIKKERYPLSSCESGAKRRSSLQTLPLRPQITAKAPTMAAPVKKRRAPLPPLTPKMISQLEQMIKQDTSTARPAEREQINIEQLTPDKMKNLKLALKDFAVDRQMARDKWINTSNSNNLNPADNNKIPPHE